EVSADLRQRQQRLLATLPASLAGTVEWMDGLPAAPWRGALLANEVLDALPVKRFVRRAGAWLELGVSVDQGGATGVSTLGWKEAPASADLVRAIAALDLPAD